MPFQRYIDLCLEHGLGYDPVANECVPITRRGSARVLFKRDPRGDAMAVLSTRRPLLTASDPIGGTRPARYSLGPTGTFNSGFTANGNGGITGGGSSGGGAPSWLCAIIGRSSCSYADVIAAGFGYLIGQAGGGGGGETASGGQGTGLVADTSSSGCPAGSFGVPPYCFDLQPGGEVSGGGMMLNQGEAVMGRYGAALVPDARSRTVLRCPRGAVLGADNLCYNRRDLRKDERKWPPGRKPLLTGGDLNAISRAARAASRVKTQQKRLEKLGLLKRPHRGGPRRSPGVITKAEAARALRS